MFTTVGCWDRKELNELVIVLGWGMDIMSDGEIQISAQYVIPARYNGGQGDGSKGANGKIYSVESAIGKNIVDAVQKMQTKLPRRLFRTDSRIIVIGEELATHGIKQILDTYTRDPELKLRTDLIVVKGGTAKDFLQVSSPLESIPALAANKEHQVVGGTMDNALRDFLIASTTEGVSATIPAVELITNTTLLNEQKQGEESNKQIFVMAGTSIFSKDIKLVGFLNMDEDRVLQWVTGNLKKENLIVVAPQGLGNFSVDVINMDSKIQPEIEGETIKINVTLTGEGTIIENNTKLDLSRPKNLTLVQNVFNHETQKSILKIITKVQKNYGTDVFGFGETVHRKYPYLWKELQKNWEEEFKRTEVSVEMNLKIKGTGLTGPPMHLKEDEISQ